MTVQRIALTFLLGVYFSSASAQTRQSRDRTLTTADGLPSSTVTGIVQDQTGFIWIGTADGLARFDGRQLKVFRHDERANSLAENAISSVQLLSSGILLLQTHTGDFQQFDPRNEQFTTFFPLAKQGKRKIDEGWVAPADIPALKHTFWALWRGEKIQVFDQKRRLVHTWDESTLGNATKTLHSIVAASNGRVYAHSDKGLIELNFQTGQHRFLAFQGPLERRLNTLTSAADWRHVIERPNGEIIALGQQYLHLFNPKTGQFRGIIMPGPFRPKGAYAMRVLADGKVYVSIGNHLYELLPTNLFIPVTTWESSAGDQRLFGMPYLIDRSGVLWLYTTAGSVHMLHRQAQPFRWYGYQNSWTTDLPQIGLGAAPLPTADRSGDNWVRFTRLRGSIWCIGQQALYQYVPGRQQVEQTSSFITGDSCLFKIALKPDQRGNLWIYGNEKGGLTELDTNGHVRRFWPNSLVPQPLEHRGLDLSDIQPMGSVIWMASNQGKGLYRYDLRQQKIVAQLLHNPANRQSLPTNQLRGLLADPHAPGRVLWIGTLGGGLTRFDTQTNQFRTFTQQDGLPDNTIQSLQTDRQGFIWAATNRGLVRLDTRSFQLRVFTKADGLQDDEFVFAASTQLPDGRLAFGGSTGITVFDPATLREQTAQTPVVLSALRINNELIDANTPNSPLPSPINALSELMLDHTQNFLTFDFSGLDYTRADQIQYQHRLTGVDPSWVNTGTQNTANYTQLAPGHYQFAVMATNADGRWSRQVKQLSIVIKPPFWASWWAYAAYFLAFTGLVWSFIRFRIGQGQQRQTMLLERQKAEQLKAIDELKTRFFSNITHEFRTPLSLILSPTEKLLQEAKHDGPTRQTLASVHRNAGQLLHLVNQLLDLSKLEGGGMSISLARGNVAEFVEQLVETFRVAAEQKGIALTVRTETDDKDHLFDVDKWLKIGTNILANALKFTPAGGTVSVELTDSGQGFVCLVVADTGIGIRAEKLPHIFDRFYQVDDTHTRAYEGTGIGLALVKELIDILGGTVAVASDTGKGTTFTLHLPVLPALGDSTVSTVVLPKPTQTELASINSQTGAGLMSSQPKTNSASQPLVLVVEDNEELRNFITGELAQSYQVLTATNGAEGWELAQSELPHLVISDVMMPLMDGYELTHRLKTSSLTSHIGVVLLSARAAHESRMAGLTQGADDYLTKPFHVDELRQRLHNLLTHQQTLRDYYHKQFTQPDAEFRPELLTDDFLRKLHGAVDEQLDNPAFGVDELAQKLGMSRRTLDRKLAAVVNQSANNVIRQHRLKRAAQFLTEGRTVSEAAYLVGYESAAHFSQIFKELFQKTPTEFTQR